MAVTWVTRTDVSPGTTGSWQDVDLDTYIGSLPSDVSGVILQVFNNGATTYGFGARKNGSTDNRTDTIRHHGLHGVYIGVDADNIFEIQIANAAIEVYVVGYMQDADAVWHTNGVNKYVSSGAWTDVDITTDTGGAGAIACVMEWQGGNQYGHRQNGSTDNRTTIPQSHMWSMAGCDGDEITEVYRQSGGVSPYLVGWFLQDLTVNNNAVDQSLSSTSTWTNITANASGDGALVEVVGSGNDFGIRNDGSSVTDNGHPGGDSHGFIATEMTSDIYEGYITATDVDFFEILTFDGGDGGGISVPVAYHNLQIQGIA